MLSNENSKMQADVAHKQIDHSDGVNSSRQTVASSSSGRSDHKDESHEKHNIVEFSDQSGVEVSAPTKMRRVPFNPLLPSKVEMSIETFLMRPREYFRFTWSAAHTRATPILNFDIPDIFKTSPQIMSKIENFRFLSARVHVRVMINANKFAVGRLLVYSVPFPTPMPVSHLSDVAIGPLYQHTAYNCAYVDVGDNNVVDYIVPFTFHKEAYDLRLTNEVPWSRVFIEVLNPYDCTEIDDAQVTVYAWMENISLTVPVQGTMNSESVVQAARKVLDGADAIVGTGRKALDTIEGVTQSNDVNLAWIEPVLMGALSTFGFSKPVDDNVSCPMYQIPGRTFTNIDGECPASVLGATHKNQNLVDVEEGNIGADEMEIVRYCSHRAMIDQFTWSLSQPAGTVLWKAFVTPGYSYKDNSTAPPSYICSPLAYVASMFQMWRGSIQYQLGIVANQYYSGRLEFIYLSGYNPSDVPATLAIGSIEGAPRVICDIKQSSECTFLVPYLNSVPWSNLAISDPRVENIQGLNSFIGTVVVVVHNPLRAPPTVPDSIELNVFMSGGDDIEFANPSSGYNWRNPMQSLPVDMARNSNLNTPVHIMTEKLDLGLEPSKLCVGEKITNLRNLTRRFQQETQELVLTNVNNLKQDTRFCGGNVQTLPIYLYMIANTFRFWKGSRRYMYRIIDDDAARFSSLNMATYEVPNSVPVFGPTLDTVYSGRGHSYQTIYYTNINPMPVVVQPYYSQYSKLPTNFADHRNVHAFYNNTNSSVTITGYTAAGDDWSAFVRIAPPPIINSSV